MILLAIGVISLVGVVFSISDYDLLFLVVE